MAPEASPHRTSSSSHGHELHTIASAPAQRKRPPTLNPFKGGRDYRVDLSPSNPRPGLTSEGAHPARPQMPPSTRTARPRSRPTSRTEISVNDNVPEIEVDVPEKGVGGLGVESSRGDDDEAVSSRAYHKTQLGATQDGSVRSSFGEEGKRPTSGLLSKVKGLLRGHTSSN
jgi:hypothetical protein